MGTVFTTVRIGREAVWSAVQKQNGHKLGVWFSLVL